MGSNGGEDAMVYAGKDTECSEATVEIKIKTLDSQTYSLRVDKCVPVPALKEQIAIATGVLSEQQRLICRGKVLKDDQLLSAYHVEDGHTLHLVVRQPIPPPSDSLPNHPAGDPASSTDPSQGNQAGPGLVVETFNISEQGDRVFPDLSRIISAVLGSFGMPNVESGTEGIDLREAAPGMLSETLGLGGLRNSIRQQSNQTATRGQYNPNSGASLFPAAVPLDPQQPQVIPDSLTTLSQYLGQMRQEFSAPVRGRSNNSQTAETHGGNRQHLNAASPSTAGRRGLPIPSSLAEVLLSTRQILSEQAEECLSHLTRQLEDHINVTGSLERMQIQSNALRTGFLLQNLGALLLELGRTTMTLNMGQTPADAVVNAGPAVFISTSGPNPMMVQPLPFHPGMSFGAIPLGTAQPGSGPSEHTVGSGFLPRNIDIRIRTGSLMASVNQSEPTGTHPLGQTVPAASGNGNSQPAAAGATGSLSSTTESGVRVVPIRALVAGVPAPVSNASSNSSRGSLGIFYPVLARVQRADSRNLNSTVGSQASDERNPSSVDTGGQPIPDSAAPHQNIGVDGNGLSSGGMTNGQGFSAQGHSGLDQLLRTIFPGEPIHGSDIFGTTEVAANTQEAAPAVGDEGTFLSNLLHQIMPIISQNAATGSNSSSTEGANVTQDRTTQASSTQAQEDPVRGAGTSSRQQRNPSSQPSTKRQKRE